MAGSLRVPFKHFEAPPFYRCEDFNNHSFVFQCKKLSQKELAKLNIHPLHLSTAFLGSPEASVESSEDDTGNTAGPSN